MKTCILETLWADGITTYDVVNREPFGANDWPSDSVECERCYPIEQASGEVLAKVGWVIEDWRENYYSWEVFVDDDNKKVILHH